MVLDRVAERYPRVHDNSTFSLSMSLRTCLLHFSLPTTVVVPYPNDFTKHALNVQSVGSCNIFENKVVTLNNGKFAVFDDTLDSFECFSFAFDA